MKINQNTFKILFILLLVLTGIQLTYNLVCTFLNEGLAYRWFLFDPADRFADLLKTSNCWKIHETWPYSKWEYGPKSIACHPPLQAVIYLFFSILCKTLSPLIQDSRIVYFLLQLFAVSRIYLVCKRNKYFLFLFLIFISNYGFLMLFDRANVLFIALPFTLISFTTENQFKAAAYLAISTSIKIVPALFILFILFKFKNNWKKIIINFILCLLIINILSIIILYFYYKSIFIEYNFNLYLEAAKINLNRYLIQGGGSAYSSSLMTLISYIVMNFSFLSELKFIFPYLDWICLIVISCFFFFIILKYEYFKVNLFKLSLLLISLIILFTPVTFDYYLSLLAIPLIILKNEIELKYFISLLFLLAPKNYFIFHEPIQLYLNPLLLIIIISSISIDSYTKKIEVST